MSLGECLPSNGYVLDDAWWLPQIELGKARAALEGVMAPIIFVMFGLGT